MRFKTKPALAAMAAGLIFLGAGAPPVAGQGAAALVTGTVQDETGAVLPGATVTATNQESGVQRVTVTDEFGRYRLPALMPGTYRFHRADLRIRDAHHDRHHPPDRPGGKPRFHPSGSARSRRRSPSPENRR